MKPKGTQVSLRELATQMISISDNSATDILLHTLGREKVEAMLPVVGVRDPARNRPFLGTLELFKLKGIEANNLAARYLAENEAGRRRMLDGEIAGLPLLLIKPTLFRDGKPVLIEQLEWFLSPADLVRVMDWLRRNTEGPRGADARAVLSKNPGIGPVCRQVAMGRLQGRLGARRHQHDAAAPGEDRRLVCPHRKLERSRTGSERRPLRCADHSRGGTRGAGAGRRMTAIVHLLPFKAAQAGPESVIRSRGSS